MTDLFVSGGPFMLPMTILAAAAAVIATKKAVDLFGGQASAGGHHAGGINTILHIGIFCFFAGVLSQAMGLYQALGAIVQAGDVSPALIFDGLRVSFIAPIYGLIILLVSLAVWSVLRRKCDADA